MKLFSLLIFSLTMISNLALGDELKRVYFQLSNQSERVQVEEALRIELRPVSFGLTVSQRSRIYELSSGESDFQQIYSADVPLMLRADGVLGYKGDVFPGVLPPSFSGDPQLAGQWWIEKIQAPRAWAFASGEGVTIADCDAGFYQSEPDIAGNLLMDYAYDTADKDDPTTVNDGAFAYHGTAVVAIMAGVVDGVGTSGIAYNAKVMPIQNYNYNSSVDDIGKEESTARCVLKALENPKVQVIVLENQTRNGSSETFVGTREAVKLALRAGVTIVSAAGNNDVELTEEAHFDTGSIIVGALSKSGKKAKFSNFGSRITTSAFGSGLWTLFGPDNKFGNFGGTSGATPQVAGAVALMLEVNPHLVPAEVKWILQKTSVKSKERATVGGLLDVYAAVTSAANLTQISSENRSNEARFRRELLRIL